MLQIIYEFIDTVKNSNCGTPVATSEEGRTSGFQRVTRTAPGPQHLISKTF